MCKNSRHSNHRQQQENGTQVGRRIPIISWPCQQLLKSATDVMTSVCRKISSATTQHRGQARS